MTETAAETAPTKPKFAYRLEFVDRTVVPDYCPVHVTQRAFVDGEPIEPVTFSGVSVRSPHHDATVVTFHDVHAPDVRIEVTCHNEDGTENLRLWWAGREWLTPRDVEQIKRIREAAAASDLDQQSADFSVFAAEVIFRGAAE